MEFLPTNTSRLAHQLVSPQKKNYYGADRRDSDSYIPEFYARRNDLQLHQAHRQASDHPCKTVSDSLP